MNQPLMLQKQELEEIFTAFRKGIISQETFKKIIAATETVQEPLPKETFHHFEQICFAFKESPSHSSDELTDMMRTSGLAI